MKLKTMLLISALVLTLTSTLLLAAWQESARAALDRSIDHTGFAYAPRKFIAKFSQEAKDLSVRSQEDIVTTDIGSIDVLNTKFSVVSAKKLFPSVPMSVEAEVLYESLGLGRIYEFTVSKEVDIPFLVEQYKKDPNVEAAEPDYVCRGHGYSIFPNDPMFGEQWALHNDGTKPADHPGKADCDIDAPEAWQLETGNDSIVVAVIDTGIDWNHPDLDARIWTNTHEIPGNGIDDDGNLYIDDVRGWDFVNDDNNPMDDNGHGTGNAGIIGSETNNGIGVAGVDWLCKLMPVKVLNINATGYYSWIASGIYYASNNGARVINLAMGGTDPGLATLKPAVDYAYGMGCVIVAAMGLTNDDTVEYPAGYNNTIAVGATDTDDTRCVPPDWTHISPTAGSCFGSCIDVVAPGNWILGTNWNDKYDYWGGTSAAVAHVSGLASLLLAQNQSYTNVKINQTICSSAEDQVGLPAEDTPGWDQYYGYGRINAAAALTPPPPPPIFDVTWGLGMGPYYVNASCNDIVTSFNFTKKERMISFILKADDSGFCNVTIPRCRLDDPFTVTIDESSTSYTIEQNETDSMLSFTYTVGTHYVKITGTKRGYIIGDINCDGQVNIMDIAIVARNFGHKEENYP